MENIYEEISKFAKREREEAEKAVEEEESQVCIKADSYIAKEIKYQTALLHQILGRLDEESTAKHYTSSPRRSEKVGGKKGKEEVNAFAEERKLLRKQMKLLAEQSEKFRHDTVELASLSEQMVAIYLALAFGKATNTIKTKTAPVWKQSVSINSLDGITKRNTSDLVRKYRDDLKALTEGTIHKSDI